MPKLTNTYAKKLIREAVSDQPDWDKPFGNPGYRKWQSKNNIYSVTMKKFTNTTVPVQYAGDYWSWHGYVGAPIDYHFVYVFHRRKDRTLPDYKLIVAKTYPDLMRELERYQYVWASLPYDMRRGKTTNEWLKLKRVGNWW